MLKGASYIFANNANAEKLHTAKEQDQHNDGGIAGDIDTKGQLLNYHKQQIQECGNGGQSADGSCNSQGLGGIADNALNGVVHKLSEAPLAGACLTGLSNIGDEVGAVANPSENTLGKAVILCYGQQAF